MSKTQKLILQLYGITYRSFYKGCARPMTSTKRILFVVFILIFFAGISFGLIGRAICTRDNENYQELQLELFAPDEIATVLRDEDLHQIYVCYNDASYVSVS